jgi:hypothetical protein
MSSPKVFLLLETVYGSAPRKTPGRIQSRDHRGLLCLYVEYSIAQKNHAVIMAHFARDIHPQ